MRVVTGAFGSNHEYTKRELIDKLDTIELQECYTCKEFMT